MDNAVFSTFINSVRPKLYRFSLSLLKQHDTAEDVVQEVGLRLWQGIHQGNHHPHLEALAMCTAKNLCIDILRRNNRSGEPSLAMEVHHSAYHLSERTPQLILEEKDMYASICQLIEQLPLQQRMAIRLRDVEGYELAEIAHILECDERSVRANLSRARKKIREQICKIWNQ